MSDDIHKSPKEPSGRPRRLAGDAAWKAHLDAIGKLNGDARKKAAARGLAKDAADAARAHRLKGD